MPVVSQRAGRVLVLGLGNTILSDDGVGIYVARRVRERLDPSEPIDVAEAELAGFALLDLLEGYAGCILVDAVQWPGLAPGEIQQLDRSDLTPTARLAAGHQIDLPTALELGQTLGRPMPERVAVVAVQVADPRLLGEECTAAVAAAIGPAAELTLRLARMVHQERAPSLAP